MKKIFIIALLFFITQNAFAIKPIFRYLDKNWVNVQEQDMTDFWSFYGLQEKGFNYYTSARPIKDNNYWERFNPLNDRYQAWCGVYVAKNFEHVKEWGSRCSKKEKSAQRAIDLLIYDMGAWLDHFKHPSGFYTTKVIPESIYFYKHKKNWYKVSFILKSGSDLGGTFPPGTYDPEQTMYSIYPVKGYKIFSHLVEPYHDLILFCKMRFKYLHKYKVFVAKYNITAKWKLKNGNWKYPTRKVLTEIEKMIRGIKFGCHR